MTTPNQPQVPHASPALHPTGSDRAPMRELPYRPLVEGEDYWVVDDILPDPMAVRHRVMGMKNWIFGAPRTNEVWPGMRTTPCVIGEELEHVESVVRELTGSTRLWVQPTPVDHHLCHNVVQVVGAREGYVKPHTDARSMCKYAAIIYLTPDAPRWGGTAFYRQQMPSGHFGGNIVEAPYDNMVDALGTRFVPADSFVEDLRIDNVFNRLVVYKANLVHSATGYFGTVPAYCRMTNVFFWHAE